MLDVARNRVRNMLKTRSQHVLFECCKHHDSQHGKSSSQHHKSCSQHHYARLATRSTTDTLPHLNRAAADPSDASARIGRPGASSSVLSILDPFEPLCTSYIGTVSLSID
jgi:hypothetical protein